MALQPFVGPWTDFGLILYTVGRTPWKGDQPVARPLPTQRTTQTENKHTHISMLREGFEPTTPVFERAKTVPALDHATTVISICCCGNLKYAHSLCFVLFPILQSSTTTVVCFPVPTRLNLSRKSSGSGTGSTQPREYNWGATWKKNSGSCLENREYGRRDPSRWPRGTLYPQKLAITSPTSGGRSVHIVHSRTHAMEFSLVLGVIGLCILHCLTFSSGWT
jgi:hypothetical protein